MSTLPSATELGLLQLAARLNGDKLATDALRRQVRRAHFETTSSDELEEALLVVLRKWERKETRAAAEPTVLKSSGKAHRAEDASVEAAKKDKRDKKDKKKDKKEKKKDKKEKKAKKGHRAEVASEAGGESVATEVDADALAAAMDFSDSDDGGAGAGDAVEPTAEAAEVPATE